PLSAEDARAATAPKREAAAIPSWAVGVWKCDTTLGQVRVQLAISLGDDSSYTTSMRLTNASGEVTEGKEAGTFQVEGRAFVFTPFSGKDNGVAVRRKFVSEGGYLWILFSEIGYQLPFTKNRPEQATTTTTAPAATTAPAPVTVLPATQPGRTSRGQDSDRGQRNGILPRLNRGRK